MAKDKSNSMFTVFSQKLAAHLMLAGFNLMAVRQSVKDASRNVYFFKNSPALISYVADYTAQCHKL